jgi:hypothetical protein
MGGGNRRTYGQEELTGLVLGLRERVVNLEQQVANQAAYQGKLGGRLTAVEDVQMRLLQRVLNLEQQVANQALELHKWTSPITLKSQAAQQQATEHLYAPLREEAPSMRGDVAAIVAMRAFIERFLAMDDLGLQVNGAVRDDAREALGRARVES